MAIINVLVAFDAKTILKKYSLSMQPDSPTLIDGNDIYMITTRDHVVSEQSGSELNIKAEVEDVIHWREASVSIPEYSVILYHFNASSGGSLIDKPQPDIIPRVMVPMPSKDENGNIIIELVPTQDYYWSANVLSAGSVTYQFWFQVVDRRGNTLGYGRWDPFITISN
ncbi:hypothetical protein EAE91_17665 [Photorhabdus noenieputensis]|uniref:inclusion body family protein n=1 Tax=Photorhabdus noenieputensis TaxID=1208607 RepID=UPI001BD2F602|nr:inclusion body family protein [Photorhabdus noenieputensis]MBS9438900.1 hypothetical protein [Photorhabdus noenieputensis]MCK3671153.1 inclusion body family protein [Photorhabdus noenieputensis]